jgi:hypothetical protein
MNETRRARPGAGAEGGFWIVFGAAVFIGALQIDRLEGQGVEWFAAPGLLPAVLGLIIAANGALIAWRSVHRQARVPAEAGDDAVAPLPWRRVALTLVLCLGFAVGLVGRGMPFGVAAGLYLFVHMAVLERAEHRAAGRTVRGLLRAALIAVGVALAVPFVFEQLFLVRLP